MGILIWMSMRKLQHEVIMQISSLSLNTNILSMGSLLGTGGNQALIDSINARCGGSSFFGSMNDPFRNNFQNFMQQVILPIREAQQVLASTANKLLKEDTYRVIDSVEELEKGIPPCMQLGIVYYHPLRKMLENEQIDGFGIDYKTLADVDPYEDPLKSGFVELHTSTVGKNGEYTTEIIQNSVDPDMSFADKEALRKTREFIDQFMNDDLTRSADFTNYPHLHG